MNKKIIGYTDGCFDLFHVGHLNLIKSAKSKCDYLIVGVHSDAVIELYKKHAPIINENDRRMIVEAIKYVDQAVINETRDKLTLWHRYHFNVIFVGDDWKGTDRWNKIEKMFNDLGVKVVYLPYTKDISSTMIKEKISEN